MLIDNTLSFDAYVNSVCKAVNYHAKAQRRLNHSEHNDWCLTGFYNAILHGTSNIQKLQRAQNLIARIVTSTRLSEHIAPVIARLHWLKIAERIEYEVALLTFKTLTTCKPDYLSDQLQLCAPVRQSKITYVKQRF